ncbi:fumarate/nitrate reduction transcriptional regulator Fnr [Nitrosomonas sp. Nm58]|uniref:fumarate/nitrate reduction transcriptional regulator Fnr n=1 Tax=Nitrosomonas sp. Nm58 TaxID=200126 RepID=UPI00089546D0|nr:fumarate/nitrate reduction transcriptional regulator Fnr [Nitrosomonas sp. Nm58]SDY07345.1 CRP/FNR family transcriptional regulator, anaerobic regulatory protein [Nitrosomonas sp. Nm58]
MSNNAIARGYVVSRAESKCATCSLRELCLPVGLDERETEILGDLINHKFRIRRGEHLLHAGLDFSSLYAVRNGFFKSYVLDSDGRQQVTGFYMTGELLGLDAISSEKHTCNTVALEDSEVCEVPFGKLEEVSRSIPLLMHHFHKMMSREIVQDHNIMMLLGSRKAEERLAAFLLNLSGRLAKRGYSSTNFILRMTREEIGSYLGLKLETVSRSLSRLQEEGIITINNKHVRLNDIPRLSQKICGSSD